MSVGKPDIDMISYYKTKLADSIIRFKLFGIIDYKGEDVNTKELSNDIKLISKNMERLELLLGDISVIDATKLSEFERQFYESRYNMVNHGGGLDAKIYDNAFLA